MNNDFDDQNNLDALVRSQQNRESRILERQQDLERLNAQWLLTETRQELEGTRQELNDSLQSVGIIDRLRDWAREADEWIQSQNFKQAFCRLYRQWMTKNVGTTIDLANLASLITTIALGFTLPPLTASFSVIGILRRLGDGYCREFIEND
jgi:hypothetical protein